MVGTSPRISLRMCLQKLQRCGLVLPTQPGLTLVNVFDGLNPNQKKRQTMRRCLYIRNLVLDNLIALTLKPIVPNTSTSRSQHIAAIYLSDSVCLLEFITNRRIHLLTIYCTIYAVYIIQCREDLDV